MTKPTITNQKPCEMCHTPIKANKGNTMCDKCSNHMKMIDHLWKLTNDKERPKKKAFCFFK